MSQTKIDSQLRARIDAFIEDISELVREQAMQAVGDALGHATSQATPKPATNKGSSTKKKRLRRSAEDLDKLADRIMKYVEKNEGCRMEDLSSSIGMPTKDLRRPLQLLLEEKTLKTKGKKRGTQYFIK